ncbi:MAG: dihydrodipicolinate synthase family protein [delta proteobacterium ML8_F1]|nr:MAG: dihydrodipicolinate synthase family protein [delta proteobacterium ML8_F1]
MSKIRLKGVFPPVVTPFKAGGDLDLEAFESNITKWNAYDLAGYLVLGSNGETVYLTEEEKLSLVESALRRKKPGHHVMVGTGMESLRETLSLTNKVARLGADSALVLTPNYYLGAMTDEALIAYFTALADQSEIPILIYNVPKFTHLNIRPEVVRTLSRHPNIIGMKDSTGDIPQMATWLRIVPEDFNLIVGTASAWYPALSLGVRTGILALANCNPKECIEVQSTFDLGDDKTAYEIYQRVFPINTAVTGTFGISGLKYACDRVGFTGGHVRSPLLPLKEEAKKAIDDILAKAGIL